MKHQKISRISLCALAVMSAAVCANASNISGGVATMNIDVAALSTTEMYNVSGVFGLTETYNEMIGSGLPAPDVVTDSWVSQSWAINTWLPGSAPAGVRSSVQTTTLNVGSSSLFDSWTSANYSGLAAVGGDQIGIGGGLQFGLLPSIQGVITSGDFGLRYVASLVGTDYLGAVHSGLVLTSNAGGFAGIIFADIVDADITFDGATFTIDGTMLMGQFMSAFGYPASVGVDIGTFELSGSVVPEPATYALIGGAVALAFVAVRRRIGLRSRTTV